MSLFKYIDSKVKATTVWDIGILKLLVIVGGMIFGAYYSECVLNNISWFYIAFFVLLVLMLYRVFKKKS